MTQTYEPEIITAFCTSDVEIPLEQDDIIKVRFSYCGIYKYSSIVWKFNFPNQVRHNMNMDKWHRNQLKGISLAESGTINLNTKIMIVKDYNPLNKGRMHES